MRNPILHAAKERRRIRRHLGRVEAELRAADTRHLPPALARQRRRSLLDLRTYRRTGTFPRNSVKPGFVPIFHDADGRHCAVAYILHKRGEDALIDEIVSMDNHIRLAAGAPEHVVESLGRAGLTLEEAARIQPAYDHSEVVTLGEFLYILLGSSVITGAAMALVVRNWLHVLPRPRWRWYAMAAGAAVVASVGLAVAVAAVVTDGAFLRGF